MAMIPTIDGNQYTNHKCKLLDGSIVNFDASSTESEQYKDSHEFIGYGEFYTLDVNGITTPYNNFGSAYFYKKKNQTP